MGKSTISTALSEFILKRDNYKCHYCGKTLWPSTGRRADQATIDHVIPRSKGGKTHPDNLVACCFKCNQDKADQKTAL